MSKRGFYLPMINTTLSPWQIVEERFHCGHIEQHLVRYQQSNGAWRVRRQCCNCGEYTTSDLAQRGVNVIALPVVDETLRNDHRSAKQRARDELRYQYLDQTTREQLDKEQLWWANYNRYLQSDHWKQLRLIVLKRDEYRCQNCFRQVAEQTAHVHHLTYVGFERVGKSFAFECVTLCALCHVEFHPGMQYR